MPTVTQGVDTDVSSPVHTSHINVNSTSMDGQGHRQTQTIDNSRSQSNNVTPNSSSTPMSLERKLELLESRFTQPSAGTSQQHQHQHFQPQGSPEQLWITTAATSPSPNATHQHGSNSAPGKSLSFASQYANNSNSNSNSHYHKSNLPPSSIRSRRRPSLQSSLHAVERATTRHLRKVAANSPIHGTSSNQPSTAETSVVGTPLSRRGALNDCNANSNSRMSNMSAASQQTLLTSHVHRRRRIVAESPPVPVTPGVHVSKKPSAARTLIPSNRQTNAVTSRSPSSSTRTNREIDNTHKGVTGSTSKRPRANNKRKSVPKRKNASIKDRSQWNNSPHHGNSNLSTGSRSSHTPGGGGAQGPGSGPGASPEPSTKRARTTTAPTNVCEKGNNTSSNENQPSAVTGNPPIAVDASSLSPRRSRLGGASELSRERSNSAGGVSKKISQVAPNNRSIHDFFSSNKKRPTTKVAPDRLGVLGTSHTNAVGSKGASSPVAHRMGSTSTLVAPTLDASHSTDWMAKCKDLEIKVDDLQEQLKAVTNNKTILHTALQSALGKTRSEYQAAQAKWKASQKAASLVLEDLLRWKSNQQAKELREKLAADGARLGRIVYARAGMRALESWEEGYATKDLEQRKKKLQQKRKALEARKEESNENDGKHSAKSLETMEARESIQMHLKNLEESEAELAQEEQALNDEKGAHIRALKRVASEDASRFRHRPKLHDRYVLHCLLGKGGFSEVWRGYDLVESREVAVKIHQLDSRWPDSKKENYTKHVSREYEIHRNVRHPRIVSLYDVFEIDNNSFATVLECCKGTDLDTLLKSKRKLPERQARALLLQILSGMSYLSQPSGSRQGIIHYDLKPGNILFDEIGDAKITDFGLSKIVDAHDPAESMELTSQGAGTYWYLPPECFITDERVRISNKVDVWSIGVIYFQMLYGRRPFGEGKTQDKLLSDHTMLNAHQVQFLDHPSVSQEGKEFIRQCLMYDQAFRPTIAQLCEHPYVVNFDL